jgi:ABC-2 type transport system ATP-binding protein
MIRISHLDHYFGAFHALKDIDLTVPHGCIAGFIGPNGAGKSTLLKILAGYVVPTSGEIFIDDVSLAKEPFVARSKIGYMQETPHLYREMRVEEYLDFVASLKGLAKKRRIEERESVIVKCGLTAMRHHLVGNLSKGNRQRAALAQAIIGGTDILLLDEPTSALDPGHVIEVRNFIKKLKGSATVVMSSHILSEISQICDYIIFIRDGEIQFQGPVRSFSDGLADIKRELIIRFAHFEEEWTEWLSALPGSQFNSRTDNELSFSIIQEDVFFQALFQMVVERRIPLREIMPPGGSQLEALFQEKTK